MRIWLASLDDVDPTSPRAVFSPDEWTRARGIGSPLLRHRFLARRWMARDVLAAASEGDPARLVLERRCGRCGGLHPVSPLGGREGVWWSASSSAGLAAVAVADARIGLDLEQLEERLRWQRIARRFYADGERRAVAAAPERFLEFWTLKEAFLKALGVGLPGGLRSLDCTALSPGSDGWSTSPAHPGWRFRNLSPQAGFVAALAVDGGPDSIELRRWDPEAGRKG